MTTNETITATANQSKRTFTLRTFDEHGNVTAKYRTYKMTQEEFENEEMNTEKDWKQFLKTDDYYKI